MTHSIFSRSVLLFFMVPSLAWGEMIEGISDYYPAGCGSKEYSYEIVRKRPHNKELFTEGLVISGGSLYESVGRNAPASIVVTDPASGKTIKKAGPLPGGEFAEGITILNGTLYQLTWEGKKGFIIDPAKMRIKGEFGYEGEGWGLTADGHFLIMSDGTNRLRFIEPEGFGVAKTLDVFYGGEAVPYLNELEYIKGKIYANVWHSDLIMEIDPSSGSVTGCIDISGLYPREKRSEEEAVPNGIAYDADNGSILVTGKMWPEIFEIRLIDKR